MFMGHPVSLGSFFNLALKLLVSLSTLAKHELFIIIYQPIIKVLNI